MKHLKRINELFDSSSLEYKLALEKDDYYVYEFEIDDYMVECDFSNLSEEIWEREYNINGRYDLQVNNPYKIVSTVTDITINFINLVKPDAILIKHLPMDVENVKDGKKNKRATINYQYLSKRLPKEYKLHYENEGRKTYCVIYNNNFDISKFKEYKFRF